MKKLLLVLSLALLVALAAAAAAGLAGGRATSPPAAEAAAQPVAHWCNFVMAGKDATADGSVMMGYNNDWSANNYQYLQSSRATRRTTGTSSCSHAGPDSRGRRQREAVGGQLRDLHRPGPERAGRGLRT